MVAMNERAAKTEGAEAWWAWSPAQGWVVLDRRLPQNRLSVLTEAFEFVRCRDWTSYQQEDRPWNYREAAKFLNSLPPEEAMQRQQELEAFRREFEDHRYAAA